MKTVCLFTALTLKWYTSSVSLENYLVFCMASVSLLCWIIGLSMMSNSLILWMPYDQWLPIWLWIGILWIEGLFLYMELAIWNKGRLSKYRHSKSIAWNSFYLFTGNGIYGYEEATCSILLLVSVICVCKSFRFWREQLVHYWYYIDALGCLMMIVLVVD